MQGKLFAAFGISGTGKSSVMQALARELDGTAVLEKNSEDCFEHLHYVEEHGNFNIMMWFRDRHILQILRADALRRSGEQVFLDCYFEKAHHYYIHKPEMSWLIPSSDPYFPIVREISKKDLSSLPDADVLIYFDLSFETWKHFIEKRQRPSDKELTLDQGYAMTKIFNEAAEKLCEERGIELIKFQLEIASPKENAKRLKTLLEEKGLITNPKSSKLSACF